MAPDASMQFAVNERVLCYHGPVIYEAKILKAEMFNEANTQTGFVGPHYWVHYKGWKATWDEWVHQDRLLKYNDVSLQKQKAQNAEIQAADKKSKSSSTKDSSKAVSGTAGGRRDIRVGAGDSSRKRKRDDDDGARKPELKLMIPDVLKVVLVDDWEHITKNHMLVHLPRTPSVRGVLDQFEQHVLNMRGTLPQATQVIHTLILGLQTYFDRALGSILLYRFERAQYAEIRKQFVTGQHVKPGDNRTMSTIYGAEHLARLLVKLPEMVAHTTMDDASVALLREYVEELMRWMCHRKSELFSEAYEHPAPTYTNIART